MKHILLSYDKLQVKMIVWDVKAAKKSRVCQEYGNYMLQKIISVWSKLAGSPGFPEENSAADPASLTFRATTQSTPILLLFLCVCGSLEGVSIFGFGEFIKQIY